MKVFNQTAFKMAQEYCRHGHKMDWDIAMDLLSVAYGIDDLFYHAYVRVMVKCRQLKETGCDH